MTTGLDEDAIVLAALRDARPTDRVEIRWAVDLGSPDGFLYTYAGEGEALGMFVPSRSPLPAGVGVCLQFLPGDGNVIEVAGVIAWANSYRVDGENPNPGMGVRLLDVTADLRERLLALVPTLAYLPARRPAA